MEPLRVRLGEVIVRRRQSRYSQEAFADVVGVHRTYMGSVERGRVNISLDNLERIARALDVALSVLLREAEELGETFVAPGPGARRPRRPRHAVGSDTAAGDPT